MRFRRARKAALVLALTGCTVTSAVHAGEMSEATRLNNAHQATPTVPAPSIRELVNALPYKHYDPRPAMQAYRLVAAEQGWSSTLIEAWAPFVNDVMFGESAYCWNRRNGDVMESYSMCHVIRTTTREDVGFGQVTRSYYGSNAKLCTTYGVCSAAQILASPYDSMLNSIIRPIEFDGSRGWCYSRYAREYHRCDLAPDRW